MFIFRHGSRRVAQAISSQTHITKRFASKIEIPFQPPPVPIIEKCPAPTCQCRESPPGLDIEREQNINGSMAAYAEQILICTGKDDWKSRIEDEEDAVLVNQLKKTLTRGGKYVDVRGMMLDVLCMVEKTDESVCDSRTTMSSSQIRLFQLLPPPHNGKTQKRQQPPSTSFQVSPTSPPSPTPQPE